jgi:peptidoglycan/LPS O-acetylase OafA/YrhL
MLHLEGMRGIAAVVVVIHHLQLTFFSASSSFIKSKTEDIPHILSRLLLALVESAYNGTFAVWLFWILSAFVLSKNFFLLNKREGEAGALDYLQRAVLRRYPRLLLPVIASVTFAYSLHELGFMYNNELAHSLGVSAGTEWLSRLYNFPASLTHAIKCAVWDSFFDYELQSSYNSVLWSMEKEYYGSLFLFAFLALFGLSNNRYFLYPFVALVLFVLKVYWLIAFVSGILLCDAYVNRSSESFLRNILNWRIVLYMRNSRFISVLAWIIIFAGVGLGSYSGLSYIFLGTAMVLLSCLNIHAKRFLSGRIPVFLGKISFGLYLFHLPLICSFSCWSYLVLLPSVGAFFAVVIVSVFTCVLSIAGGGLLYIIADRPALTLSRKLSSLFMGRVIS